MRKIPTDRPEEMGHNWIIVERSNGTTDGILWCRDCMGARPANGPKSQCRGKVKVAFRGEIRVNRELGKL